jgi:UDPglucose 6-dehydrogenase
LKISVIGTGYVGLVTGCCFAEVGHEVLCTDNDPAKLKILESGKLPIYEPGLDKVIEKARKKKLLKFSSSAAETMKFGDAIFICVGTPPLPDGDADLSAIDNVARQIATEAQSPKLVVEKSTVPARTGQELKRALAVYGRKSGIPLRVASNPEFLREGTAIVDFMHPDRIVVGVEDEVAEKQLREIYKPVLERNFECPVHEGKCPPTADPKFVVTTINSAELIKHASNSFLAMKISYANMVADLAEKLGADIEEVMYALGLDPRIGGSFLKAGLGFGGFCLPKDVQAFMHLADRNGVDFSMLREAEKVNHRRIDRFLEMLREALWVVRGKQIGVLGLAFKANTDDTRFAPAIKLIERLVELGAIVKAYDPEAMNRAKELLPNIEYCKTPYEVANDCEALVIATEWDEFRKLDWEKVQKSMLRPLVLDARNLLSPKDMRAKGFEYRCFGRPE